MGAGVKVEDQRGILWRIARLHPGWNCVLIMTSLVLPVGVVAYLEHLGRPATPLGAMGALFLIVLANLSLLLPLLYIYGTIILLSGRYHSRGGRSFGKSSVAMAYLAAVILGFFPLAGIISGMAKDKGFGPVLLAMMVIFGIWFAFKHLLTRAAWELVGAEGGDVWQRKNFTRLSLLFWPIGFFWIQARIRRLVGEYETGVFSRLPLEDLLDIEETREDVIYLTSRVVPEHAEAYAEQFARHIGTFLRRKRKMREGITWEVIFEKAPLALIFQNEPPTFRLEARDPAAVEPLRHIFKRLLKDI